MCANFLHRLAFNIVLCARINLVFPPSVIMLHVTCNVEHRCAVVRLFALPSLRKQRLIYSPSAKADMSNQSINSSVGEPAIAAFRLRLL